MPLRAELAEAEQALARQEFDTCIRICDQVLARDAINLRAHLYRGVACGQVSQLDRAISDLQFVLERQPEQAQAVFFLGQALRRRGRYEAALGRLRPLVEDPRFRHRALFESAICLNRLGRRGRAMNCYRELLQEQPGHADAAANLADLLERSGLLEEAENWVERALLLVSGNASAQLTRARLCRQRGQPRAALAILDELEGRDLSHRNRSAVYSQMAQCLEDNGNFGQAFGCYTKANAIQRAENPEALVDDYGSYGIELAAFMGRWLQEHPLRTWSATPADDRTPPVFMIGFPCSGADLLGQALSAHPAVEVLGEEELLLEVRRKWISPEHFPRLHSMSTEEVLEARQLYRNALAAARSDPDASLVVDMLPLNSMYVQLIHRLFPDARFILVQRDPRDVCLACFFQTFELLGAMPYFLELETTVRYYDTIMQLLDEARARLPLNLHEVRVESLARAGNMEMKKVADFLGLAWDESLVPALQAGQQPGSPARESTCTGLAGRWEHYREQLSPFLQRLEPWVRRYGYGQA